MAFVDINSLAPGTLVTRDPNNPQQAEVNESSLLRVKDPLNRVLEAVTRDAQLELDELKREVSRLEVLSEVEQLKYRSGQDGESLTVLGFGSWVYSGTGRSGVVIDDDQYSAGPGADDYWERSAVFNRMASTALLEIQQGYESTFFRTLEFAGYNDIAFTIDGVKVHPFVRNPVDKSAYTIEYGNEGTGGTEAAIYGDIAAKVAIPTTRKVSPSLPAYQGFRDATPANFTTQLASAQATPATTIMRLRLGDGTYNVGDLSITKDNMQFVADNPGEVTFTNLENPSITWTLVVGTTDVYEATSGGPSDTSQVFWPGTGRLRRLSPSKSNTVAWTDSELDAAPNGGWFFDTNLKVKIPGGGAPGATDIHYSGGFKQWGTVTGDNFWMDGVRVQGYGPQITDLIGDGEFVVQASNMSGFHALNCTFDRNLQSPIQLLNVDGFYVEMCTFADDKRWMTYQQARNSGGSPFTNQFLGTGPSLVGASNGIIRNCFFSQLMRGLNIDSVDTVEIHNNVFEYTFGNLISVRGTKGRLSVAGNVSNYSTFGFLSNEEVSPIGPSCWANNLAMHAGWPGFVTWDDQTYGSAAANRFGGVAGSDSVGYLGVCLVYNNTCDVTETHTTSYSTNFGWVSASKDFVDDDTRPPSVRMQNNLIQSLKDTDSSSGNYGVIYACCGTGSGEAAARGIKWDGNHYWIVNGGVSEIAFNFHPNGQLGFDDAKSQLRNAYEVEWEPNGAYSDPGLGVDGQPANPHTGITVPGITGNAVIGSPTTTAGSSKTIVVATRIELESATSPINITGKVQGKLVWDSTYDRFLYASGSGNTDWWNDGPGTNAQGVVEPI